MESRKYQVVQVRGTLGWITAGDVQQKILIGLWEITKSQLKLSHLAIAKLTVTEMKIVLLD